MPFLATRRGFRRPASTVRVEGVNLQSGLVDEWLLPIGSGDPPTSFSEFDYGSNALNLTAQGSPLPNAISSGGGFGGPFAVQFNAANTHYFTRADTAALRYDGNGITFVAWVYPTDFATQRYIFSKMAAASTSLEYLLQTDTNGRAVFIILTPAGISFTASSLGALPTNAWSMLSCWHDPVQGRAFMQVNAGGPAGVTGGNVGGYTPTSAFSIGRKESDSTFYWNGRLNSILRWNRVLNAAERNVLFTNWIGDIGGGFFSASSDGGDGGSPPPGWPPPGSLPAAPTGLDLLINGSAMTLEWINNAVNATGIEVWRSSDYQNYSYISTVPVTNGSCYLEDPSINPLTGNYSYKVRAVNLTGASAFSSEVFSSAFITQGGQVCTTQDGKPFVF